MSDDNKSPFGEKTVVAGAIPAADVDVPSTAESSDAFKPQSAEKTVVFAQSNLKETFDARTVVRSSKPTLPTDGPVKVPAVELPVASAETTPGVRADSFVNEEKPKLSSEERRAARAALDKKTRTMVAAFVAVCVMALLVLVFASGGSGSGPAAKAVATETSPKAVTKKDLASETDELTPGMKKAQALQAQGAYKSTTEVLSDFDRAAKRAQDHALEYSR